MESNRQCESHEPTQNKSNSAFVANGHSKASLVEDGREGGEVQPPPAAVAVAPDGGYGWVIAAACFVLQAMIDGTFSVMGVFLPELVSYFTGARGQVALVGSVMGGCVMLSGPLVSIFVNACGCRLVSMVGTVTITVGMLLASLATSVDMLVVTLGAIVGIGLGMIYLPSVVMVGVYFERRRALASGVASSGAGLGVLVLAPLAAFLLQHYDWRNALVLISGVLLQSLIAGALFRPVSMATKTVRAVTVSPSSTTTEEGSTDEKSPLQSPRSVTSRPVSPPRVAKPTTSQTLLKAAILHSANGEVSKACAHPARGSKSVVVVNGTAASRKNRAQQSVSGSEPYDTTRCISSTNAIENGKGTSKKSNDKSNAHKYSREDEKMYYSNYEISVSHATTREHLLSQCSDGKPIILGDCNSPLLQRKDIFYSGSIHKLSEYRSQPDVEHYIASVTIPTSPLESNTYIQHHSTLQISSVVCGCIPSRYFSTMWAILDLSLFRERALVIISVASAVWQSGYMIPLLFVTDYGRSTGMNAQLASVFVAVYGACMIFGRGLGGAVGNLPRVNPVLVIGVAQCVAGLMCTLVPFCHSAPLVMAAMATVGFMLGPITPLTTVCLVDYLGLARLTNAVGLVSLSKGVFCFFGAPLAGMLLDWTGSYVAPFALAGATYATCGLLFMLLLLTPKHASRLQAS